MIGYKLTDENMQTHDGFQWQLSVPLPDPALDGTGELCSAHWIHLYDDPLLAVLLNPIGAEFKNPRLFRAEWDGLTLDDRGLKRGVAQCTLLEQLELPHITQTQRIAFGILCTRQVYHASVWMTWAERWLSGEDRTAAAAAALDLIALAHQAVENY